MQIRSSAALAVVFALAACEGNPFIEDAAVATDPVVIGDVTLPDGPSAPVSDGSIERYETADGSGGGVVDSITYDADTDTIRIGNLPYDGDGTFDRDDVVGTLNGFSVYENNNVNPRRNYKTVYGVSASGETRVALVRVGDYEGFGFGGFVYARDGTVTIPTTGQATYTGDYAGIRVLDGAAGLQYTQANAVLEVDFEDFDATDAVEGAIFNREILDLDGNVIGTLPLLYLATGSITEAGEIAGVAGSDILNISSGDFEDFEAGNYYAVMSGSGADEIVGVIVVTGDDPNDDLDITHQETGAFIVTQVP